MAFDDNVIPVEISFGEALWKSIMAPSDSQDLRLRLKTSEGGRIYNILEAGVRNIEYLTRLCFLRENKLYFDKNSLSPELKNLLSDYYELHRSVSDNIREVDNKKTMELIRTKYTNLMAKCQSINWNELILKNPAVATDRTEGITALDDLRNIWRSYIIEIMDHLEKNPEEVCKEIKLKVDHEADKVRNDMSFERLKKEHEYIVTTKGKEISSKQKILDELLYKINLIDSYYKSIIDRHEITADYEIGEMHSESQNRQAGLTKVKDKALKELDNLKKQHGKKEDIWRHKRVKLILDLDQTLRKYDSDMEERAETLKELNEELDVKMQHRREIEEKIQGILPEYEVIEKEQEYKRMLKEAQIQLRNKMVEKSVMIQAWWRGTLHRIRTGIFVPGTNIKKGIKVELDQIDHRVLESGGVDAD